ncbi:glycosyltransferase family 2 protein [Flavobacterium sp. GSP27]|uniref:glycosyltransferase family 2 protein n=1 Tax=unclassified Flavobacterium TaxID=196869 RepID=UPI000F835E43|nr:MULTISPECIES: glycosyltransferase family A protein [unclassified Flavobacterium]RTY84403.1 glycosyltransferase family 2 protein [Flavobacterium sp. LS1P28]RTZ09440.1 glycosyltransferase family 2 protein [Flavobacterium sp. GSP27]
MTHATFTILLTTKNRKTDLAVTLAKIQHLFSCDGVERIVCDDGSTDDTAVFVQAQYPEIQLIKNKESKGLIYSRNRLLGLVNTEFAISLDDDAHFITVNALSVIADYFAANPNCGVLALRIFWGLVEPDSTTTSESSARVQGFVGCGHVWRMSAWNSIPDYPAWFIFYGEEDFAAYQLFKKNIEIHYLPEVLVHHRVDVRSRRNNTDYSLRLRRSLRSGWYLYFLFFPLQYIPKKMAYSIWMQLKSKVFKGDWKALKAILWAMLDLVLAIPKIIKNSNRLTRKEYSAYQKLEKTKLYWRPENESH